MPLVGWAILVQPSKRTPSVTRSVLAKSPLPTSFPSRGSSLRTPGHRRCRHRQGFVDEVMPVNPRSVVESQPRPRTMREVVMFSVIQRTAGLVESMIVSGKLVRAAYIFAKTKLTYPFFTLFTMFTNNFNPTTLSTSLIRPDSSRESNLLAGVPKMSTAISSKAVSHSCTSPCLIRTRMR